MMPETMTMNKVTDLLYIGDWNAGRAARNVDAILNVGEMSYPDKVGVIYKSVYFPDGMTIDWGLSPPASISLRNRNALSGRRWCTVQPVSVALQPFCGDG